MTMIAEVVFNLPLEKSFHYLIPEAARDTLEPGMRVLAPFGPRERMGFVVERLERSPIRHLKAIRRVVDPVPVIAEERWALASWLSGYYCCSLGEVLAAMVPSALRLAVPVPGTSTPVPGSSAPVTEALGAEVPGTGREPDAGGEPGTDIELTADQRRALAAIRDAMAAPRSRTVLLNGVTGSGKTELYLRAIAEGLSQGRSAICLIPEIALTPQTIDRFRARFGGMVAVWHSRMGDAQRATAWQRLRRGEARIVVGARSAVFAPVTRLGLVILDEEHEPTYKQEDTPRYHAREVAVARAKLVGATVVLGSATPSVESRYAAGRPGGILVTLPQRVKGRPMPTVELVDMRDELMARHRLGPLSARLTRALAHTVDRGEQAMLLLNRRGFARVASCPSCGYVARCVRCAVPLVYHAGRQALLCHYCNFHEPPPELCPACRKGYLRFRGSGTERVESELHRLFPLAAIARMDRDTTRRAQRYREVYDAVRTQQVGVLVGTQMIAKGLDFPQVTLVGVVSADTALNLPDFRAGERTFDLLTQMAGRAGRGQQPGRVLIQTFCPRHYAIQAAQHHDYRRFYEEELAMRRRLRLPPFVHLVELTVIGSSLAGVQEASQRLADALRRAATPRLPAAPSERRQRRTTQAGRITVLGPAPHRLVRLRRAYRMCVLLKAKSVEPIGRLLRQVLDPGRKFRGLPVLVNVDPL